jgi:hypothetical protein
MKKGGRGAKTAHSAPSQGGRRFRCCTLAVASRSPGDQGVGHFCSMALVHASPQSKQAERNAKIAAKTSRTVSMN